jgi:hypothetical protein
MYDIMIDTAKKVVCRINQRKRLLLNCKIYIHVGVSDIFMNRYFTEIFFHRNNDFIPQLNSIVF